MLTPVLCCFVMDWECACAGQLPGRAAGCVLNERKAMCDTCAGSEKVNLQQPENWLHQKLVHELS